VILFNYLIGKRQQQSAERTSLRATSSTIFSQVDRDAGRTLRETRQTATPLPL